ncbi:MAG: DUF559 domain-containing protein [Haliscomenobacter sp.]|nr:DUF559 domain-containing protein [Haliscomenobacter sp.]
MAALQKENPTEAETYLWEKIRNKKLGGYKFRRQHIIDRFIADFICLDESSSSRSMAKSINSQM